MCDTSAVIFKNIRFESQFLWEVVSQDKRFAALRDLAEDYEMRYDSALSDEELGYITKIGKNLRHISQMTHIVSYKVDGYVEARWKGKLLLNQLSIKQVCSKEQTVLKYAES